MKRAYLLNLNKYQGICKDFIEKADDNKINEIYENEKLTEQALYEGINNYRVNWYENLETIKRELKEYIKKNNIKEFKDKCITNAGYFGNYCLPYIIEKDALKLKEYFGDKIRLDLFRHYIGKKELENLKVGDKVKINKASDFGFSVNCKGTVYKIEENTVTIKKYRSKTKGWIIKTGEEGNIYKGW